MSTDYINFAQLLEIQTEIVNIRVNFHLLYYIAFFLFFLFSFGWWAVVKESTSDVVVFALHFVYFSLFFQPNLL